MKVGIVLVTYNRLAMLRNALEACLAQPQADRVYVVDNCSTDGTGAYLADVAAHNARVMVLPQAANLGGAGGFAAGMRRAMADGCQWMWIMDDDVLPTAGGLAALLAHTDAAQCLYPAKRCADGRMFDFEYRISRATLRRWRLSSLPVLAEGALLPSNSGTFEGALVHRSVVERVGLPDPRFFIVWDDAFWGMRAAEHFTCCYLNTVCIAKQQDKERLKLGGRAWYSSSLFSRFHFLRNYWEVLRYLRGRGELSPLAYVRYGWEFAKAAALTLVLERNPRGLAVLCRAAWQGMRGDFTPWGASR